VVAELPTLATGTPQPLSALAPPSLTGEGRYILLDVPFRLPWDWLLLSSQKARLDLGYRFAPGLPDGALMLVKINGTTVRLLPFDAGGGKALPVLPITFGARLLRPGRNRLAFEVLVPGDPVDRACPLSSAPVVEIAATSTLFVPAAPRMSLPAIDRALASLSLDRIGQSANATGLVPPGFVPEVATALAMRPDETPAAGDGGQLTIGTLADLEAMHSDWFGDGLADLSRALTEERLRDLVGPPKPKTTAWDAIGASGQAGRPPRAGFPVCPGGFSPRCARWRSETPRR
jgi:hypothetical protein